MKLRTLQELDVRNKRVLMRVDFNVPLKKGVLADDTRIRACLPSIQYVLDRGGSLVLMSHLGRPGPGKPPEFSVAPAAHRLEELLGREVLFVDDCIGEEVERKAMGLQAGQILVLENVRYYDQEKANDPDFAGKLAKLGEVFVNDAFGTAHRSHASTEAVAHLLPSAAGFLMQKEVDAFLPLSNNPKKPMVSIIGGAKVSSKIGVLEQLMHHSSAMIIGGGMSYTFLKSQGYQIGRSLYEQDYLSMALDLIKEAKRCGVDLLLPLDHIAATEVNAEAKGVLVDSIDIPQDYFALDIGPKSIEQLRPYIASAGTIFWNGPMGVFEFPEFANGTRSLANMVADSPAFSVVGGGDSVAAANLFGVTDKMDHVSTGGGASLELVEGRHLPGLVALEK
ncbi:MAG: phosphoglycerate kinase [Spirochaetaceae bacterium]|nr:MAG: phosphoglycerate kinase [Spirochaetaceae bacterium]